jgi:flagellar hook-basal body complex protein FliE
MTGIAPIGAALPALPSLPTMPTAGAAAPSATGFADQVAGALEHLNQLHGTADGLAQQAAVGTLEDVHDYTIAATEANLATELTVAVRNKAVESFNEIMRMQV